MSNNQRFFIFAAALALGLAFAPAWAKIVDSIALVVDQDAMTQGELQEAIQSYFASQQSKMAPPGTAEYDAAKKQVEEAFIREVLLAEEADREKIDLQEGEVDREVDNQVQSMKKNFATDQEFNDSLKAEGITLDDLKQDIRDKMTRRIKAAHMMRQKQMDLPSSVVVTDEEARKYYDQHPNNYDRVRFSIILLRVSPQATAGEVKQVETQARSLLKQVKEGANFAALAKKYSEDPGSAADGGDIGTVSRGEIGDAKLAEGVFALPAPGTGLVRATDGIYVVKVVSRGKADFDSAAADIKIFLKKQMQDNAVNTWIDSLKNDAYIVEDGKVISSKEFLSAAASTDTVAPVNNAPATMTAEDEKLFNTKNQGYPSLPTGGSWLPYFGVTGFLPDATDLTQYYGADTSQGLPFGLTGFGGMDYALDPTWQVGVMGEVLRKFSQSVTASGQVEQWNSTAVGASLGLKLLIPLDESTNFTLNASGGIYTLLDSSVTISVLNGTGTSLSATDLGGQLGAGLEFILDGQKSSALDLGLDYRFLTFTPVTSSNPGFKASPLTNSGGASGSGAIDFSGFQVRLGVKFFISPDNSGGGGGGSSGGGGQASKN